MRLEGDCANTERRIPRSLLPLWLFLIFPGLLSCRSEGPGAGSRNDAEPKELRARLTRLTREEQALTAEYSLARNPAPYLVVNLAGRSVDLRIRARNVRSFAIKDFQLSPPPQSVAQIWQLQDRSPLQQIERHILTPGAGEEATAAAAKQALWGPHRMPADYDLKCEKDNMLEIRSASPEGGGFSLFRSPAYLYRQIVNAYRHWQASRGTEAKSAIRLWLAENDARLLFWSLPKQLNILVLYGVREIPANPAYTP